MERLDDILADFNAAPADRTIAAHAGEFLLYVARTYDKRRDYHQIVARAREVDTEVKDSLQWRIAALDERGQAILDQADALRRIVNFVPHFDEQSESPLRSL